MLNSNEIILLKSIITDMENYICNCCPCISYVDVCSLFPRLQLLVAKMDSTYDINSETYGPNTCFDIDAAITEVSTEILQYGKVSDIFYKRLISYYYITLYNIIAIKEPTLLTYFRIETIQTCFEEEFLDCIKIGVTDITIIPTIVNPSYYGIADGQITLEVTGDTGIYTYLWEDTSTDASRTNLSEGEYTVIVTDSDDNTATIVVNLVAPLELTVTGVISPIRSASGTGSINLSISGGTAPYTFLWSNMATTQNISGLSAGTYSVTVTDNKDYTETVEFTLEDFLSVTLTGLNISCHGDDTGAITTTIVGGKAPFTYIWNTGASTANLTGLTLGNYSVKVIDAYNNSVTKQITLTQAEALRYSIAIQQPATIGGTGQITLTINGGTAPYTYLWNDDSTAAFLIGVAGTYNVVVTDSLGCTLEIADIILYNPMVCTSVNIAPTCHGNTNGSITLSITGGTEPYTFDWSDDVTTQNRTSLAAGTYTVMITDAGGRFLTKTIVLEEPDAIVANEVIVHSTVGALGSITLSPTGGSGLYTYLWTTGATTSSITGLYPGTYGVTITDSAGCTLVVTNYIVLGASLILSLVKVDADCNLAKTGSITLTVTGGTSPYTYLWNDLVTTQNRANIEAGTYSVSVTDSLGQTSTGTIVVGQATALVISSEVIQPTITETGSITLTVTGGTPFVDDSGETEVYYYTYLWEDSSTLSTRENLTAGTYSVVVTDANGCTISATFVLTVDLIVLATTTELNVYTEVEPLEENTYEFTLVATGSTPGQIGFKFPDNYSLDSFQIYSNNLFTEEDLTKWTLTTADGYKTYTYTYMTGEPDPYNEFIEIFETQTYKIILI